MKHICTRIVTLGLLAIFLTGCGKSTDQTGTPVPASEPSAAQAAAILADIGTTQYFTEEAVAQEDVELIVQAGVNAPSAMNSQPWHFSVITDRDVLQQISEGMGGGMGLGAMPLSGAEGEMPFPEGMDGPIPEGFDGQLPEGGFPGAGEVPEGFDDAKPEGMMPPAGLQGSGGMSKAGITDAPLVIVVSCAQGSQLDAGLACQNMSATAQLLGYGTKILTSPTMALNGSGQDTFRELLGIPQGYSAAAVLLIGNADTGIDQTADGYTGATARNDLETMVTYIP